MNQAEERPEETGDHRDALVYDWAATGPRSFGMPRQVMLDDETLRDGLQSPSVRDPDVDVKVQILHLMNELGIETANIGLPGAGPRQREAVETMCREIAQNRLRIRANCAGRTVLADIQPMADVSQRSGVPIEACLFIGSSPIRQFAEQWDIAHILRLTREAIQFAVAEGLDVMYVTEDTVRSSPEHLRVLLEAAVDAGAKRLCLCDTVGAATPEGTYNLVYWVKALLDELGVADDVGIDWHGHRDRGLGLANTLAAVQAGATRVHGTALGVGERIGNTPMELLLVNLRLLGVRRDDLSRLMEYIDLVSKAIGVPVPVNTPVVGKDAFRTATGVHAAAVVKALRKGDEWLADRVYSGVPASWIGRRQLIEISHMSGASNVVHYLQSHGLSDHPDVVAAVLARAKRSERVLDAEEILEAIRAQKEPRSGGARS